MCQISYSVGFQIRSRLLQETEISDLDTLKIKIFEFESKKFQKFSIFRVEPIPRSKIKNRLGQIKSAQLSAGTHRNSFSACLT